MYFKNYVIEYNLLYMYSDSDSIAIGTNYHSPKASMQY